jgi:hypothetical protein
MEQERKRSGDFFGAAIIILIGLVLLLNNFGVLPWSVWTQLWRFWPVLLIVAGIQMLGGNSSLVESLVSIVGIVILIIVILLAIASVDRKFDNWMKSQFPQWPRMYNRFENFNTQELGPNTFDSDNFSI